MGRVIHLFRLFLRQCSVCQTQLFSRDHLYHHLIHNPNGSSFFKGSQKILMTNPEWFTLLARDYQPPPTSPTISPTPESRAMCFGCQRQDKKSLACLVHGVYIQNLFAEQGKCVSSINSDGQSVSRVIQGDLWVSCSPQTS